MNTPTVSVVLINKNEDGIADTVEALKAHEHTVDAEIVVVDASSHRYDALRDANPDIRWVDFAPVPGKVTIPHQRNAGVRAARGEVIVYTDASCVPEPGWLDRLVAPILAGDEQITAGAGAYGAATPGADEARYLDEAPTINLAFTRSLFEQVGEFDERYAYGSDIDFSWRLQRAGVRIRNVPDAVVSHDWGPTRRHFKRAFQYGEARARLYATHPWKIRSGLVHDPVVFVYPAYLLALPLAASKRFRWLPLLVAVPLVRNRRNRPFFTVAGHVAYSAGALTHVWRRACGQR